MSVVPEDWFAVRCVLRTELAATSDGPTLRYEERITLWRAGSFEAAIGLAEAEADEYIADGEWTRLEFSQAFQLFESPGHGAEVFSLMRDSDLSASAYLDHFFDTGAERQT